VKTTQLIVHQTHVLSAQTHWNVKVSTHARMNTCILKIQHAAGEQQGPDSITGTVEKNQGLKRDRSGRRKSQCESGDERAGVICPAA